MVITPDTGDLHNNPNHWSQARSAPGSFSSQSENQSGFPASAHVPKTKSRNEIRMILRPGGVIDTCGDTEGSIRF